MDVSLAYEAIKVSDRSPELDHVTVKSSIHGVRSASAISPLTIKDSNISGNVFAVMSANASSPLTIKNSSVSSNMFAVMSDNASSPLTIKDSSVSSNVLAVISSNASSPLTIKDSSVSSNMFAVMSDNASSPLTIRDSFVRDNVFVGIQIKDSSKGLTIENTVVSNTTNGHGLSYSRDAYPVNFCSDEVENMTSFPIYFEALGKPGTTGDCAKVGNKTLNLLLSFYLSFFYL